MSDDPNDRFDRLIEAMARATPLRYEGKHQAIKHQVRHLTHVPPILKLPEILQKVLLADMDMRPHDPKSEITAGGILLLQDVSNPARHRVEPKGGDDELH